MGQKHNIHPKQLRLFDPPPRPAQEVDRYDPMNWINDPATVWHSTFSSNPPHVDASSIGGGSGEYTGFHVGTRTASEEANYGVVNNSGGVRRRSYPFRMVGDVATPNNDAGYPLPKPVEEYVHMSTRDRERQAFSDEGANSDPDLIGSNVHEGNHIPYVNKVEDYGSISYRANPGNLRTWSEHVLESPDAPEHWRELAKTHDLVAHSGEYQYRGVHGRDSFTVQDVQSPLPGIGTVSKIYQRHPSEPPRTEIIHTFKDRVISDGTGLTKDKVTRQPIRRFLTFEPKENSPLLEHEE
jgi:hypothetical protein